MNESRQAKMRARRRQNQADMLDGRVHPEHGTISTYTSYMCRCVDCRKAMSEYQAEHHDPGASVKRNREWHHQTPPGSGERNGLPWTEMDFKIGLAMGPDNRYLYTSLEAARLMGRTSMAVHRMRARRSPKPGVPNIRKNLL